MSSSLVSCRYVCNPCNASASASCAPRPFRPLPSASRTNSSIAFARYIFILHPLPPFVPSSFSLRVRMSSYHASSTYLDLSRKYHILILPLPQSQLNSCLHSQSREGVSLILGLLRQARMQPMTFGRSSTSFLDSHRHSSGWTTVPPAGEHSPGASSKDTD